jgi:hypothetical protein
VSPASAVEALDVEEQIGVRQAESEGPADGRAALRRCHHDPVDIDQVPQGWEIFGQVSFAPGERLAMPKHCNVMWIWYNEALIDENELEPPDMNWTTDDWAEAALKATKKNGDDTVDRHGGGFCCTGYMKLQFYTWSGSVAPSSGARGPTSV